MNSWPSPGVVATGCSLLAMAVVFAGSNFSLRAQPTVISRAVAASDDSGNARRTTVSASKNPGQDAWTTSVADLRTAAAGVITIIDVRSSRDYGRGHVPGAVRVSWLDYRDGWGRTGRLPKDLDRVATAMAALGVDSARPVVVYGEAREGWGEEGRVAWMLHYLGHPRVTILDGGWPAWQRAGGSVSRNEPKPGHGRFAAHPRAEARATADDVARAPSAGIAILDTRSTAEWNGSRKYWPERTGRIPGAVHLEWRDLLTPTGLVDRSSALRERLRTLGLTPERPVIAYCVGGVRSGEAFMVLKALGFRDVRNYDGSWYEWAADARRPVVMPPRER